MKEFENLRSVVFDILVNDPNCRENDNRLYAKVLKRYAKKYGFSLNKVDDFFMKNFWNQGIPNYESVGRARRRLQEEFPELRATKTTQELKEERREAYRKFYKKVS